MERDSPHGPYKVYISWQHAHVCWPTLVHHFAGDLRTWKSEIGTKQVIKSRAEPESRERVPDP